MKATPLTIEAAQKSLKVELIANGKGTQAVHDTVVAYRANRRAGTHSTKTKATVSRSGKKPWRQKGTGRARAGYASSPIWRGGGVVFGPHPRDYSKKTPKKVKRLALLKVLSERIKDGDVLLVDKLVLKDHKTKALSDMLIAASLTGTTLIVTEGADKNVYLAARNNSEVETATGDSVNAENLLQFDKIIITSAALDKLAARLQAE